ncbi:MAG: rRNA maturation RNase YbeY [Candidatus Margulisbacteria bacterium]|nr:rRNA maturation RNase YbeY [Candidatus Margulisiibacteriota bacterium]
MFEKLIKEIVKKEKKTGRIDLAFVRDKKIQELNRRFREQDKPTDVLSFNYDDGRILGDVIISSDTTARNAKRYGVDYRSEVKRLVIHGTLHVLGYDHGRRMRHAEEIYSKF